MPTEKKTVRRAVREESEDGRLGCAAALALARRLEVDPKEIGKACNAQNIKIVRCQLGCFG